MATVSEKPAKCVNDLLEEWTKRFQDDKVKDPRDSIQNILAHSLQFSSISDLYKFKNRIVSEVELAQITTFCTERLEGVPIPYILGEWKFRNLNLKMSPPVFIPWTETEGLIDLILEEIDKRNCRHILDLCCGSGAISLALIQERPQLRATAVDQCHLACALTQENAITNNLQDRITVINKKLALGSPLPGGQKFDVIVSNAPYVPTSVIPVIEPRTQPFEDIRAVDGGNDGLDVVKLVTKIVLSSDVLNAGGKLFLEVYPSQPPLLRKWLVATGLPAIYEGAFKDFSGQDRYVVITKTLT